MRQAQVGVRNRSDLIIFSEDLEVKEPRSWSGLFGAMNGWSGGSGDDAEIYG